MRVRNIIESLMPKVGRGNEGFRERWLEEALLNIPDNSRILDAGAGTQRYRKYCRHLEYVSQDFGEYDGKGDNAALQKGKFDYGKLDIISDIVSIPEPDTSFDAIMCIEVLEHLPDPVQAIREFTRLLKPNGHLILTAPFCSFTHFAPYHFGTGFNEYWYEKHLFEDDYVKIDMCKNGNYFEFLSQEIHRIPSVSSRYSKSKPNLIESLSIVVLQRMLFRFSQRDQGSSEFLCFGHCIHARKT